MNDFLDDKDLEHGQEQQSVEGEMCSADARKKFKFGLGNIGAEMRLFNLRNRVSAARCQTHWSRTPLPQKKKIK